MDREHRNAGTRRAGTRRAHLRHLPQRAPIRSTPTKKSGRPESNQGPSDSCDLYSQMLYQLSYSRLAMQVRRMLEGIAHT